MVAQPTGQGSLLSATIGGFKVESLIGRGATATVYLARDIKLGRKVALKVLLGSLARSSQVVKQFQLEAQATAPLNHPNIVRVYAAGIERGTPYMAMELVEGEPLDRFLKRKGRLQWQHALHIGEQVLLALDCAHSHGLIHRDIKPSNIMLDSRGRVRLTDFGIASIQNETNEGVQPGMVIGTPQYMSPEQCTGQPVTGASDLFSTGVTLHQMLAGELPFTGESPVALVKAICTEDAPRLNRIDPDIPDDVARFVAYLMEKDPGDRPANAKAAAAHVRRLQEEQGGRSALPMALTAFLKEEAQARPFAGAESSIKRRGASSASTGHDETRGRSWRATSHATMILLAAVAAFTAPPAIGYFRRDAAPMKAPLIDIGTTREWPNGGIVASVYTEDFQIGRIAWTPESDAVVVELQGTNATLAQGASALFAFDVASRQFRGLRPPSGPGLDADFHSKPSVAPGGTLLTMTPLSTPFSRSVLIWSGDVLLQQSVDAATPDPRVLFRRDGTIRGIGETVHVVPAPDGHKVCLALHDAESGVNFLAEREVANPKRSELGDRFAETRDSILPDSIQYANRGDYLFYVTANDAGNRTLHRTARSAARSEGETVLPDLAGPVYAISRDGSRVAAQISGDSGPELVVYDLPAGTFILRELGASVSVSAWFPHSDELVVLRSDNQNQSALWRARTHSAEALIRLSPQDIPIGGSYAISPDGAWVVAEIKNPRTPTFFVAAIATAS